MTNKQVIALWDNFLKVHCNCYPDEFGNRPCDKGTTCNRCMTSEMNEKFNLAFKVAIEVSK